MPFFSTPVGLAGDANVLAILHFGYLAMLLTLRGVLNQQFKNLKEERRIPVLFLINKLKQLCITKSEPGV